jgi:hypothetical protein
MRARRLPPLGFLFVALASCSEAADGGSADPMATGGFPAVGSGGALVASGGTVNTASGGAVSTGGVAAATGGAPSGTGGAPNATGGAPNSTGGAPEATGGAPNLPNDFDPTAADFECVQNWTKVRNFRITNKAGRLDETLAVANNTAGGTYPVGTIIQLVTTEAMVKRGAGFSPETSDWEFFFLDVTAAGATIVNRGTTTVVNQFNGNCFQCHSAAEAQFDLVCETGHGCAPLPIPTSVLAATQDSDPRCP